MSSLSIPHLRSALLRLALVLVVVAVTLAGVMLAAARPASGQASPTFPCDGGLYVVAGSPNTDEQDNRAEHYWRHLRPEFWHFVRG
jgi:hypothetical protein